jgi:anti-anti-sigma regulatory factor
VTGPLDRTPRTGSRRAIDVVGASCFITGIQPAVARLLAGSDLGRVRHFNTLADGLARALRDLGESA